jgi:hypothetical protein
VREVLVLLRPLQDLVIERVTFMATRAGGYRLPVTEAFRAALREALPVIADAELPLETFDPESAVSVQRNVA